MNNKITREIGIYCAGAFLAILLMLWLFLWANALGVDHCIYCGSKMGWKGGFSICLNKNCPRKGLASISKEELQALTNFADSQPRKGIK